jgi:hypothetical protein
MKGLIIKNNISEKELEVYELKVVKGMTACLMRFEVLGKVCF